MAKKSVSDSNQANQKNRRHVKKNEKLIKKKKFKKGKKKFMETRQKIRNLKKIKDKLVKFALISKRFQELVHCDELITMKSHLKKLILHD